MYKLSISGRGDIISETRVFIARNKEGSRFEYDAANYDPMSRGHHLGLLLDAATGKFFRIDYEHQRVTVLRTLGPDAVLPLRPPNPKEVKPVSLELSLGSRVISGIQCFGKKVAASGPNYPGGESWAAPSLNYELVEGTILNYADNVLIEVHLEDIQVGQEADPELFRIPEGYQTQ